MNYYEHPTKVEIPFNLLVSLAEEGFTDVSYGNDEYPSFSKEFNFNEDNTVEITIYFIPYLDPSVTIKGYNISFIFNNDAIDDKWINDVTYGENILRIIENTLESRKQEILMNKAIDLYSTWCTYNGFSDFKGDAQELLTEYKYSKLSSEQQSFLNAFIVLWDELT